MKTKQIEMDLEDLVKFFKYYWLMDDIELLHKLRQKADVRFHPQYGRKS